MAIAVCNGHNRLHSPFVPEPGIAKMSRRNRKHKHPGYPYSAYSFSNLERSNKRFRTVAWTSGVLLVGVVTALLLNLFQLFK